MKTYNISTWERFHRWVYSCILWFVGGLLSLLGLIVTGLEKLRVESLRLNLKYFSPQLSYFLEHHASHLIIVAGHAALRVENMHNADHSDIGWYLLDYQKNVGYPEIIKSHIQKGIELVDSDPSAILIFSGGQTRRDVGPISEALSYYMLANIKNWLPKSLQPRVFLEEFAKDSFENLLFSICRFREVTKHYPTKITVVGFDFKSKRFTELHRTALCFPEDRFTYVGLHAQHPNFNYESAQAGEDFAIGEFEADLYGAHAKELREKRVQRNPFSRSEPYMLSCPEIEPLFNWCEPTLFDDPESLPWNRKG